MKKHLARILFALTLIGTSLVCTDCNSSWWQNFINNPVAEVQAFESGTQTAIQLAQTAWNTISPFLAPDVYAKYAPLFAKAMAVADDGLTALSDAVQTAVDAKTSNPDFTKLMADVTADVQAIFAIIADIQTNQPAIKAKLNTSPIPGYDEGMKAITTMKRIAHQK